MQQKMHDIESMKLSDYTCYITKNAYNGWLAYIDVTAFPELHINDIDLIDAVLPFHGGCTFAQWTNKLNDKTFSKKHFLIGCDWCHAAKFSHTSLFGVEDVSFETVKANLIDVVETLPELRLKMTIRGKGIT